VNGSPARVRLPLLDFVEPGGAVDEELADALEQLADDVLDDDDLRPGPSPNGPDFRRAREAAGISREAVAEAAGVSLTWLMHVELERPCQGGTKAPLPGAANATGPRRQNPTWDDLYRALGNLVRAKRAKVEVRADAATRESWRSRRARVVRAKTVSIKRMTKRELELGAILNPPTDEARPTNRTECIGGDRPCPFVSCKHHLYLDVSERTGAIKLNFPDIDPDQMVHSCSLDVADRGGATLEEVGEVMNLTRERVRQLELDAWSKVKEDLRKIDPDADERRGRR
jgi:transcriptional regulator with XRE-family HTH domain